MAGSARIVVTKSQVLSHDYIMNMVYFSFSFKNCKKKSVTV